MAKVCLTEKSVMGCLVLRTGYGRSEISRNDSCTLSVTKALVYGGDPNLLITFEENDREELEAVTDERLLRNAQKALGLSECPTGKDLAALLLPKKITRRGRKKKVVEEAPVEIPLEPPVEESSEDVE